MIRIDPWCCVLWACWLLLIPWDWLMAAGLAAAVHELFHIIMLKIMNVPIFRLEVQPGGARILAGRMSTVQELICALAGPVGSFFLICFYRTFPKVAICGLLQGIFNVIPIYPLDGGRVLRCIMGLIKGKKPCKDSYFAV